MKKEWIPLLFGALLVYDSIAQVDQFRSRSDFSEVFKNRAQPAPADQQEAFNAGGDEVAPSSFPGPNEGGAPDFGGLSDDSAGFDVDNPPDNNGGDAGSSGGGFAGNSNTFGKRRAEFGRPKETKKSQYVNLNPETGYGPEVITSFDFPNADILDLTKHIQKLTGMNLILDKDVRGKISIIAPSPITVGDAWKAYLTALNMSGYAIVKSGSFYKVINARDVRYAPAKIYTGNYAPNTESFIMKVFALKHIRVVDVARNFRPFQSRYGRIIDIPQTNSLIVYDTGDIIESFTKLVKFLDVPGHDETLHIIKVEHSSAQEIAKLLDEIIKSKGQGSARGGMSGGAPIMGGSEGGTSSITKIIAEPRTNSIIALANDEGLKQLRDLVKKLDVKIIAGGSDRIHVYYLNYGNAEELSKTLTNIVTNANSSNNQGGGGVGGLGGGRFAIGNVTEQAIFTNEIKVTFDKSNNALVVTASPTDWLTLKDVISRLDVPREQVYVEGMILETTMEKVDAFGVEYAGAYGSGSAQRSTFMAPSKNSSLVNLLTTNITNLSGMFTAGFGIGPKRDLNIGGNNVTVSSVSGLIKAVASQSNSNILATPQILAMDNTEATFEVGETVPVKSVTQNVNSSVQSYTNQKVAMILKITPQINKVTRFIKLKIDQKIDDFNNNRTTNADGGGAATTTRAAVTEVMVKDQDTIAMGGMMRDKEEILVSKIPLLGDIPVLGWLFKNKQKTLTKVNILYFLTPKILSPYEKTTANITAERLQIHRDRVNDLMPKESSNEKEYKALAEKLERQKQGPLFDTSLNYQYNKESERLRQLQEEKARQMNENKDLQMNKAIEEEKKRAEDLAAQNARLEELKEEPKPVTKPVESAQKSSKPNEPEELKDVDYQEILKEVNETKK